MSSRLIRPLPDVTVLNPFNADAKIQWSKIEHRYPPESIRPLPTEQPRAIPRVQHDFSKSEESDKHKAERLERLAAVKDVFIRSWETYREHAWLKDEVQPISGGSNNNFGGWAATLVDTLDTLWIMGLEKEFDVAVKAVRKIDFSRPQMETLNLFETVIRYLGGLLSAYDLSGGKYSVLLDKALELGEMMYSAFDTPNRMPVTRWNWADFAMNKQQEAARDAISSELGSLTLEMTRLSQLTGNPKFHDAAERIMDEFEAQQNNTKAPGLWPIMVNARKKYFTDDRSFTLGGMADSLYEYLPKQYILLGGAAERYRYMYQTSLEAAKKYLFFRPMLPEPVDIVISGTIRVVGVADVKFEPLGQHLTCFIGGMVALGAQVFGRPEDLSYARQLTDGCVWAYGEMATGIMPELFHLVPCANLTGSSCEWDEDAWYAGVDQRHKIDGGETPVARGKSFAEGNRLKPGWTNIRDSRFLLRPEAIESVFVLYRVTGDTTWQDKAWKMFQAIEQAARTEIGYASLADVSKSDGKQLDTCESFWTAETLKYFYLVFSESDLVSLDEFVFNTEAHPLKRPTP
ncbi:class I alpha-mannosidase [Rhizodiscina lignyota]|uniref:alpha-1,2-Mannosidase n=1 Tax=Rhizodiscina lignyota TaxID=1504668 RepID=A0A9P4IK57_9PEZI|nr:class I alpha-mannosidase [Rhizodiscina lignyota]